MNLFFKLSFCLILFALNKNVLSAQVTDALVITSEGNVQIPAGNLDVTGNITTTANLDAQGNVNTKGKLQENGNDLLPRGAIILWYGTAANVPKGWAICDGKDSITPNLSERFVVGAGGKYKSPGGNATVKIEEKHLPPHTHEMEPSGEHSHSFYQDIPYQYTKSDERKPRYSFITDGFREDKDSKYLVTVQKDFQSSNTESTSSHTHTIKKTGSGEALEILPPYYALYYIMKL